jgi:uncharacterized membrane protein YphA (DoxX/SURF4 family)
MEREILDKKSGGHDPGECPARRPLRDRLYPWAYHVLRVGLGGIFIYAGVVKLFQTQAFAHSLAQFDLLPDALVPVVALGLPALELLAGLGLVLQVRGSLAVIFSLLLIFLAVLGYAILLDLDIDCGCFLLEEIGARNSVKAAFWRDLLLVVATFFLFWAPQVHGAVPFLSKRHK